jgi:hypothetical protein
MYPSLVRVSAILVLTLVLGGCDSVDQDGAYVVSSFR